MHDALAGAARDQHGVLHLDHARALGATTSWLSRQCDRGLLVRRAPRVYVFAGAPVTRAQELLVEVLSAGPDALATADSALGLWSPELELPARPQIVVPQSAGRRSDRADLRRSTDLGLAKPTVLDGIPVVGVARALLDAARGRTPDEVVARIDACRRHRPIAIGALVEALHAHERRGRPGIDVFRQALRSLRREVTDSEFERLVVRDLRKAGLPEPELHRVVRLPGEDPIELDVSWPGVRLDVELDGGDHTSRARTARRDRQRDRLLQAAGYVVARYTWDDYVGDRAAMLAEIVRFLDQCTNP